MKNYYNFEYYFVTLKRLGLNDEAAKKLSLKYSNNEK